MEELKAVKNLGMATSLEIKNITGKSHQATIKQLKRLELFEEIIIINFLGGKLYVKPKIFNNFSHLKKRE